MINYSLFYNYWKFFNLHVFCDLGHNFYKKHFTLNIKHDTEPTTLFFEANKEDLEYFFREGFLNLMHDKGIYVYSPDAFIYRFNETYTWYLHHEDLIFSMHKNREDQHYFEKEDYHLDELEILKQFSEYYEYLPVDSLNVNSKKVPVFMHFVINVDSLYKPYRQLISAEAFCLTLKMLYKPSTLNFPNNVFITFLTNDLKLSKWDYKPRTGYYEDSLTEWSPLSPELWNIYFLKEFQKSYFEHKKDSFFLRKEQKEFLTKDLTDFDYNYLFKKKLS